MLVTFKGKDIFDCAEQAMQFVEQMALAGQPTPSRDREIPITSEEEEVVDFPEDPYKDIPKGHVRPAAEVASPAAPDAGTPEYDSKGMPWDPRIHSATKAVTAKGLWRYRRGVEQTDIDRIEATVQRGIADSPAPVKSEPVHAPVITEMLTVPVADPVPPVVEPIAPVIPFPAQAPAPPVIDPKAVSLVHSLETFKASMVAVCAKLVMERKLTPEYVEGLKKHFNVQQLWDLNEEQKGQMFETFVQYNLVTKA